MSVLKKVSDKSKNAKRSHHRRHKKHLFISNIRPHYCPCAGGKKVHIYGHNFKSIKKVYFGNNIASDVKVMDYGHMTAVVPSGDGIVKVRIINKHGRSGIFYFIYEGAPHINLINPSSGPLAGQNNINIYGHGFSKTTSVKFGENSTTEFTILSDYLLNVTVPNQYQTQSVDVQIISKNGVSNLYTYTYLPIPLITLSDEIDITSLNPDSGSINGNTLVTIAGTGLTNAIAVKFGDSYGTVLSIINDNMITIYSPAGLDETDVKVVSPNGDSNPLVYNYLHTPTI